MEKKCWRVNSKLKVKIFGWKKCLGWDYNLELLKSIWNGCCWDEKVVEIFGGSWVVIVTGVLVCLFLFVIIFIWEKYFEKKR